MSWHKSSFRLEPDFGMDKLGQVTQRPPPDHSEGLHVFLLIQLSL